MACRARPDGAEGYGCALDAEVRQGKTIAGRRAGHRHRHPELLQQQQYLDLPDLRRHPQLQGKRCGALRLNGEDGSVSQSDSLLRHVQHSNAAPTSGNRTRKIGLVRWLVCWTAPKVWCRLYLEGVRHRFRRPCAGSRWRTFSRGNLRSGRLLRLARLARTKDLQCRWSRRQAFGHSGRCRFVRR